MGPQLKNDFVLDSEDKCFFCLTNILPQIPQGESSIQSLECLERFLKMDLDAEDVNETISPKIIKRLCKATLKVELCEGCASLIQSFSKLYQNLEKIKMEAISCVKLIHRKFLDANLAGKTHEFHILANSKFIGIGDDGRKKRLQLVKMLRIVTMKKCSFKLQALAPRVKLQKLKMDQVNPAATRLKIEALAPASDISGAEDNPDLHYNQSPDDDCSNQNLDEKYLSSNTSPKQRRISAQRKRAPRSRKGQQPVSAHKPKRRYNCNKCRKSFSSSSNLQNHVQTIHLEIRPYECDFCGHQFKQKAHLMKHLRLVHPEIDVRPSDVHAKIPNVKAPAPVSDINVLGFETMQALLKPRSSSRQNDGIPNSGKGRQRETNNKYTYRCNICGKGFTKTSNLQNHVRTIHFQQRQHSCDVCGSSFKQKAHLMKHLRGVHSNMGAASPSLNASARMAQPTFLVDKDDGFPKSFNPDTGFYKCGLCPRGFVDEKEFNNHYRSEHIRDQ